MARRSAQPAVPFPGGARRSMQPHVGRRLRLWRTRRGLPQWIVADRVGITQAALSNYETGKRDPSLTTFVRLAGALKAPIADLLGLPPEAAALPRRRRAIAGDRGSEAAS